MTSGAWAHLSPSVALALSAVPSSRPAALEEVWGAPPTIRYLAGENGAPT